MRWFAALLAVLLAPTAWAATAWFKIEANGQGVGYASSERSVRQDRVVRSELLRLKISRDQQAIDISVRESTTESLNGEPLSFVSSTQFSGYESRSEGKRIAARTLSVTRHNPGFESTEQVQLRADTLFPDALERRLRASGFKPASVITASTFLTDAARLATMRYEVLGPIDWNGQSAHRVRSKLELDDGGMSEEAMLVYSSAGELLEQSLDLLGTEIKLSRSTRASAKAALGAGAWNILDAALLPAPVELPESARDETRLIVFQSSAAPAQMQALNSAEQTLRQDSDGNWVFRVALDEAFATEPVPALEFSRGNAWIQSEDKRLRDLAQSAIAGHATADPALTMRTLEAFVERHIERKDLSQGYASALEAARSRRGDCTEHALLLAALGRALNIPTRVAAGFAYAAAFAGRSQVFVPHAWTQAYVNGRWRSYDAALGRFDTRRIALSFGNGEPWDFAGAMSARGAIKIVQVTLENQSTPAGQPSRQ